MSKTQSSTLTPLHEVERPPSTLRRLVICDSCHAAIQGDIAPPDAPIGLCPRCQDLRDEASGRRGIVAKAKADRLALQHLEYFVMRYGDHQCDFGKAELIEVASKIGCTWHAEYGAVLEGRDEVRS